MQGEEHDAIVHGGYVQMHGKMGLVKQRRFFALDEDILALRICRNDKDLASRQTLPLDEISFIELDGARFTIHFSDTATPPNNGRKYTALCKTPEEAAEWVSAIESLRPLPDADGHEEEEELEEYDPEAGHDDDDDLHDEEDAFDVADDLHTDDDEDLYADEVEMEPEALAAADVDNGDGYIADLTFFEFLGGIVPDPTKLLWIGALPKPVKKSALGRLRDSLRKSLSRSRKSMRVSTDSRQATKEAEKVKPSKAEKSRKEGKFKKKTKKDKASAKKSHEEVDAEAEEHEAGQEEEEEEDPDKAALSKLIAKNLAAKSSKGAPKYATRPPKGGRRMQSLGRGLFSKKSGAGKAQNVVGAPPEGTAAKPLSKDEITEKIARQARQAGGGIYLTGAATVGLAEDISKSKLAMSLAKRKEENERRKAKEAKAEAKVKAAEERAKVKQPPEQPPGKDKLAAFLSQNPGHRPPQDEDLDELSEDEHEYSEDDQDDESAHRL
ncbi:Hypothetical Protein FCC1311_024202 [Hondaea fermentalgiana]|uniref:PH domain-containing protein n=1 Tax=Hondaea fermentalgiana TaxID=2315210 RepID=A0A2R5G796_9STRA|nr:Hypothetical Protein FCC1311_024202 [Hondaea fermentalgiana]|eukprot:GBG26199.1 Hypothetical Protein FCC1311_024202 [Hondaea fermentalgiana]